MRSSLHGQLLLYYRSLHNENSSILISYVYELSRLYTLRQIIWSFTPSPLYLFCWYVSYNLCFDTHHCHCTVHYAIVHLLCCFLLGFTAFWACLIKFILSISYLIVFNFPKILRPKYPLIDPSSLIFLIR